MDTDVALIIVAGTIGFASRGRVRRRRGGVGGAPELTRTDEPGCLAYSFAPDPVDPTVVQVYELWADERSLAAHFEHPNYTGMRAILREFPRSGSFGDGQVPRSTPVSRSTPLMARRARRSVDRARSPSPRPPTTRRSAAARPR